VQKPKSTLKTLMRWDFKLQTSYGIVPVYMLAAAIYVLIVWLLPIPSRQLTGLLSMLIFTDPVFLGFLFCAVLVYYEKSENVLQAIVTTPLKPSQYLTSKVITLTFVAVFVSVIVTIFPYAIENEFEWTRLWYLVAAVGLSAPVGILTGFIIGARYKTFNEYLLSMMPYILLLMIPMLSSSGITEDYWFYYLIPTQGTLLLINALWSSVETWQIIYAICYLIVWIGILAKISLRSYERYFIIEQGGRRHE